MKQTYGSGGRGLQALSKEWGIGVKLEVSSLGNAGARPLGHQHWY